MSATTTIELSTVAEGRNKSTTPIEQNVESVPANVKVESKGVTAIIITTITGVSLISTLLAGIVTISLPAMAKDLDISEALMLWLVHLYTQQKLLC